MAGIFKAYDIRGVYGDTLTDDTAFAVGRAFATLLTCKKVVVGRDMRPHGKPLFEALVKGLTRQGADVIDLGMCSTPMCYYANGSLGADAGIMITASHNPGEWNGFKLARAQAVPISGTTGIAEVERIIHEQAFAPEAERPRSVSAHDIVPEYIRHIGSFSEIKRPVNVVVDYANAMGIYEGKVLENLIKIEPLFKELDGTFPNHEANPLDLDTLKPLQEKVREGGYDFGMAFDGDADRVGFVDEKGDIIPMDLAAALMAQEILKREEPGVVFYDLRSSWAVKEVIEENGGTPRMSCVGHAFIKQQMREAEAVFAGELSGHYYFRENYYTESSSLAALLIANVISGSDKPLSEWVRPIQRYYASGEINSEVTDVKASFSRLQEKYPEGKKVELDGLSLEFDEWWFNVRPSNTEPLVRLNLEAKTRALMESKRDEVLRVIRE